MVANKIELGRQIGLDTGGEQINVAAVADIICSVWDSLFPE
jgi:hypothetical protein